MKLIGYLLVLLSVSLPTKINMREIYRFTTEEKVNEWRVMNDGVMGGISKSSLSFNNAGYGQFSGRVSLENNGGFASIQLNTAIKLQKEEKFIVLRVKGDGKSYEFRLKNRNSSPESYIHIFKTSGEWENIKLPIGEFEPQYRGRKLNYPNFNFESIAQLSFLIGNKKEEDFKLLIDCIGLE